MDDDDEDTAVAEYSSAIAGDSKDDEPDLKLNLAEQMLSGKKVDSNSAIDQE